MDVLVLLSGGIDSVTALYHSAQTHNVIAALSFDYESKHNHRELEFAAWHTNQLNIPLHEVKLPFINQLFDSHLLNSGGDIPDGHYEDVSMKKTVVPFRNGIMLSIAAGVAESCGAQGVIIGVHSGDHTIYPDCRENFIQAMREAIQLGTYKDVELMCPFVNMTKQEIVQEGTRLGIDYEKTWSCYKGFDQQCGACGTCVERKEAFSLAGLEDPTCYTTINPTS